MNSKKIITASILMLLAVNASSQPETEDILKGPYTKYEFDHGYTYIPGERYGTRPVSRDNLETKWVYSTPSLIGDVGTGDINGDDKEEVLVGLSTGHVIILDEFGHYKGQYAVGNASGFGRVNKILVSDVDNNGRNEVLLGFGGAKKVYEYSKTGFNPEEDGTITQQTKVLYKVIRNYGSVSLIDAKGNLLWNYSTRDSVNEIKAARRYPSDKETIFAALGDLTTYIYNEFKDYTVRKKECEDLEYVNESMEYTESECDCSGCKWYDTPYEDEQGECLRTYTVEKCEWITKTYKGWNLTEYPTYNGSIIMLDHEGNLTATYETKLRDDEGVVVEGADNNILDFDLADITLDKDSEIILTTESGEVQIMNYTQPIIKDRIARSSIRSVASGDVNKDGEVEIIVGSDDGSILLLGEKLKVQWKQQAEDIVTDIEVVDIEEDGYLDIVATSRDKRVYVFDPNGILLWKQNLGKDTYGIAITDLDKNNRNEMIVYSINNVTCFELTEFYVKTKRANTYYETAYENLEGGDYTRAMIFAQKAKSLFQEISDSDGEGRSDILIGKINNEFALYRKHEAERGYQDAISLYSVNSLEEALVYANKARDIYEEINDTKSVESIDEFIEQINREKMSRRKMEADAYYTKALSFKALRNYSAAMEYIDKAKEIYEDIKYHNGTGKTRLLVTSIGDDHYQRAEQYERTLYYQKAVEYAEMAKKYYVMAGDNVSIVKADRMIERVENASRQGGDGGSGFKIDLRIVGGLAAVVLIIAVVFVMKARKKTEYVSEEVDDKEINRIEKSLEKLKRDGGPGEGDLEELEDFDDKKI
ncbi:MAG: hypothetical protein ABIH11_07610 [Candidatus Altiarchaeota archaeon]